MPKYEVLTRLKRNGVIYEPGSRIALEDYEAATISAGVLKEIKEKKEAKPKPPAKKSSKKASAKKAK